MSIATNDRPTAALEPVLGNHFALGRWHLVVCAWFAAFFVYLSYVPLFHSDIWSHVQLGKWIIEHRTLPLEDPFLPLAEGVRVVDTAWLAQVILAQVESWGGPQFLSNCFALVVFATYLVHTRAYYLISGRPGVAAFGMLLLFSVGFSRHAIIRPEIFGGLCFAVLMWMLVRLAPWRSRCQCVGFQRTSHGNGWPRWLWIATPLLFLFWANAHGSFAVGLVFLGCHVLGRCLEVAWKTRNPLAVLKDGEFRRWLLLTELAAAVTLINPYGLGLLIQAVRFGSNPNLADVLEWFPLKLIDLEGVQLSIAVVLLIAVLRHSRRRMVATEVLLLLIFAAAVAPRVRMIGWLAPVYVFVIMPHITEIWTRLRPGAEKAIQASQGEPRGRRPAGRFACTLICLSLAWCAFAVTPISQPLLGGLSRPPEKLYSRHTPLGVTKYLRDHPPGGLTWAPQWWGDWLVWDGPPELQPFMTTQLHLAPPRVWRDYLSVARAAPSWERVLDRYNVNTLVVHKELQPALARAARISARWSAAYEDELGIVLDRSSEG